MTRLNPAARNQLREAGITQAEWTRRTWPDGDWRGDACGCTDDRCIGHHHDENEECGCLPVLIDEWRREQQAPAIWADYRAAVESGGQAPHDAARQKAAEWVHRYYPHATTFALDTPVNGQDGISITYPTHGRPVPEWAVDAGRDDEYRILAWAPDSGTL